MHSAAMRANIPSPAHTRAPILPPNLFMFDTDADTSISGPVHAALPKLPAAPAQRQQKLTLLPAQPAHQHPSPGSETSYHIVSPNGYLDAPGPASPDISAHTTPGYDTLDDDFHLPDFDGDSPMLDSLHHDVPEVTVAPVPQTPAVMAGYLATPPRATASPSFKIEEHNSPSPHAPITRAEDGSWRGGLDPAARTDDYLPYSANDLAFEEQKQEKRAQVMEWLRRSEQQVSRSRTVREGRLAPGQTGRRRAKSTGDVHRPAQEFRDGMPVGPVNIPSVEDDADEEEDDYSDDDGSVGSSWKEGSLDDDDPQVPASEEELRRAAEEQEEKQEEIAEFPAPSQFFRSHPWHDLAPAVARGATLSHKGQPPSSQAAINKFIKTAELIETASRVATFGSDWNRTRRNSAGDADKILSGPLTRLSFGRDKDKEKEKDKLPSPDGRPRRPSIWGDIKTGIKRTLSNSGDKEKEKQRKEESKKRTNSGTLLAPGILGSSFARPSLSVETGGIRGALGQMTNPLLAAGAGQSSHTILNHVHRHSRSDVQRGLVFGVVSSMVRPAMPSSSPEAPKNKTLESTGFRRDFTFGKDSSKHGKAEVKKHLSPERARRSAHEDEDEEMDDGAVYAPDEIPPTKHEITPTPEGFKAHIRILNPGLAENLVERIAGEQVKRFAKLVGHRHKHLAAIKTNSCSSGPKCRKTIGAIGIVRSNSSDANGYDSSADLPTPNSPTDHPISSASFPAGIPVPPVLRLPATFECPICFKLKSFTKPSDWTKHVHEDVQPFTCTFAPCKEAKSFKRKADWVRHENESHRHLEWWECNQADCTHKCYRKDNFVQHLVREHKFRDPKTKSVKKDPALEEGKRRVWETVERCHRESDRRPQEEPCRFCGQTCGSWKKLTVHLARHMEAISLPVLGLVRDDAVVPPTKSSRKQQQKTQQPLPQQPSPNVQRTAPTPVQHDFTPATAEYTHSPVPPAPAPALQPPPSNAPLYSTPVSATAPTQQDLYPAQNINPPPAMYNVDTSYVQQRYQQPQYQQQPRTEIQQQYTPYTQAPMMEYTSAELTGGYPVTTGAEYAALAMAGYNMPVQMVAGQGGQGGYYTAQEQGWGM